MKQLYAFLLIIFSTLIFTSCQKSYTIPGYTYTPPTTGGGGSNSGNATGALVVKIVGVSGTDTVEVDNYSYDSNNKLSAMSFNSKTIRPTYTNTKTINYVITRNSNGNIAQFTQQTITNSTPASSGVLHVLHYPTGSNNCDYEVAKQDVGGGVIYRDSIVFAYNGNTITGYKSYSQIDGLSPYSQYSTITYTYDSNGNTSAIHVVITGTTSVTGDFTFNYDTKSNPLDFGNEMIYLGQETGVTKNNITSFNSVFVSSSTTTSSATYSYTYNAANYPATIAFSATGSTPVYPSTATYTYFYK